ncbi:hypothetical protein [uncultured Methylobacterium sp.]|uniref:hypothetical protein n=1 Tax=uncultured Methylobacterium sp. TaxID=157278 RepID=UPI0035CC0BE6
MPELLITDLDDATFRTIAFQAEAMNRSVDAVVPDLIRIGLLHDVEGRVAVSDRIRSMTPPRSSDAAPPEDGTAVIRELRGPI